MDTTTIDIDLVVDVFLLLLIGVGFLAWYYFGPDLVRYMKIRDM